MRVGLLTATLSHRGGGVFTAMSGLAAALRSAGNSALCFGALDDGQTVVGADLVALRRRGPKAFGYMPGLGAELQDAGIDVLHTHGLWMYPSYAAADWARRSKGRVVVSPHGMLDGWALRNAPLKKRLASILFESRNLKGAACLHALTEAEARSIRAYGLKNPICVVPNGVPMPEARDEGQDPNWADSIPTDIKILLFLGRIHPKKGLRELLHAWKAAGDGCSAEWLLVVAGWDQGGHEAELRTLASSLDIEHRIKFVGPQFGIEKDRTFRRADAFILPSHSEGLPMAVLEAWSYGLPVLMSKECNLPKGIALGAALPAEPDPQALAGALQHLCSLSDNERTEIGRRGRDLVLSDFSWPAVAAAMTSVYDWTVSGGAPPAAVVQ